MAERIKLGIAPLGNLPSRNPERFRRAVIVARQRDIMKALKGVVHHNYAVKAEYRLPESLMREIEMAIRLHQGNVEDSQD